MKLKDGHTYITRTGLKRVVKQIGNVGEAKYPFEAKGVRAKERHTYTENARFLGPGRHLAFPYDFVKEFKRAK